MRVKINRGASHKDFAGYTEGQIIAVRDNALKAINHICRTVTLPSGRKYSIIEDENMYKEQLAEYHAAIKALIVHRTGVSA